MPSTHGSVAIIRSRQQVCDALRCSRPHAHDTERGSSCVVRPFVKDAEIGRRESLSFTGERRRMVNSTDAYLDKESKRERSSPSPLEENEGDPLELGTGDWVLRGNYLP